MLTPAKKKYLFSIYEIGLQKVIIRSVDIAKVIQISKASVCNMLPVLVDEGLIEKDSDRIIALAETLYDIYKVLYQFFRDIFKSSQISVSALQDVLSQHFQRA